MDKSVNETEDDIKTNAHPILNSYFMGQVGNVAKSGLWWTTLSPLVVALIRSDTVLSPVRACYNAGVAFAPIGGVLAETVPVRTVLTYTTWARFLVWSICLPLFWFLFVSGAVIECIPAMYGLLLAIVLLDGIAVAMANVVDIDTGGADLVASNYGLPITDEIRNKFNSLHEIFMNGAIIIFSPGMAMFGILLQHLLNNSKYSDKKDAINSGSIVAIFAGGFFVLSLFSQYFYYSKIPYKPLPAELVENGFVKGALTVIKGLGGALKIIWRNGAIKWRLIFLALEIALEDAMIAVVVYEYVAQADWAANGDQVLANAWASIIIAIGKLGGVGSSILIHHHWKPPKEAKGYRPLFWWVFLGSLCVGGIPGSYYLSSTNKWLSAGVLAFSVFAFFFASTAPKLGFMTLLQSIAAMVEGSGQVFGYSAVLVTAADALVVFLINMLFRFMELKWALWIVFGIYVLHGLFELFLGPWLVLQPLQEGDMLKDNLLEKEKTPLAVRPMYLEEDPAFMGVGAPINRYASGKTPSRQHIY